MICKKPLTVLVPRSSRSRLRLPNKQRHANSSPKRTTPSVLELSLWLRKPPHRRTVFENVSRPSLPSVTQTSRRPTRRLIRCGSLSKCNRWLSWKNSTSSKRRMIVSGLNFEPKSKNRHPFFGLHFPFIDTIFFVTCTYSYSHPHLLFHSPTRLQFFY